MRELILTFYILTISTFAKAQCTIADFEVLNQSCSEENILFNNNSSSGDYLWDFCVGDLATTPDYSAVLNNSSLFRARSIKIVEQNNLWYGFAISSTDNTLLRFFFGEDVNNIPTMTNLGTLSGAMSSVFSFDMIESSGTFYAFIANTGNNTVTRLSFSQGLGEIPDVESLGNLEGSLTVVTSITLAEDNDLFYAFVSGNSILTRLSFGPDITNNSPVTTAYTVTGSSTLRDIDFVKYCDTWYGTLLSYSNFKLFGVQFSDGEFSGDLSFTEIPTTPVTLRFPSQVSLVNDGGFTYALIQSAEGSLYRVAFGEDISSFTATFEDLTSLGASSQNFAFDMVKVQSEWIGFNIDLANRNLGKISFEANCSASTTISTIINPLINYNVSGQYFIGLTVSNDGNISHHRDTINITTDLAASISYTSQNVCLTSPIQFNSESDGTGLTYAWDFGDGNNSVLEDPSHTYAAVGEYEVTLSIDNGTCGNFTKQTITIYDEPVPDFTLPGGVICTNQQVFFTNETPGDFDGLISYEWRVDNVTQSTDTDFTFEFPSGGDKEIKLIASIPGCSIEIAKNLLDVREGAVPDFTFNDACLGEIVEFNNQSTGMITAYDWDFGNGFSSNLENPSLQYASDGTFNVELTLTNTDGCMTTMIKPITIHPLPLVNFEAELACEKLLTQFNDLTTIELDNLNLWEWDFNEGQGFANDQNAQFVFDQSGDFNVKLEVTSTFGCVDSLIQNVIVLPAPESNFELDKICAGVEINFTDTSVPVDGQSITSWAWSLGGSFTNEQNPSFTFEDPLDYNVSLTVTSENLCTSTIEEVVSIPPVPSVDFTIQNDCENEIALLADDTAIEADIINQWRWIYNSNVIGTNPEVENDFTEAGDYEVELEIFTENGCMYQGLKSITINPIPTASFSVSASFGAPPLIVDFTNNSINSNAYLWDFGDGNTSDDENPSNSFDFIDEYDVELQVISDDGCRDTTSQRISVLIPEVSLELTSLELVERPQGNKLLLAIRNNGTVTFDSLNVLLDLGGEVILNETIYPNLGPNQFSAVQLDIQLTNRKLDYICGFITSFLDLEEENINDNNKCINLNESSIIINQPYPNPSKGGITFEVIATESEVLAINMIDSNGRSAFNSDIAVESGSNNLNLDLSGIREGLYLLRIGFQDEVRLYRIVITD